MAADGNMSTLVTLNLPNTTERVPNITLEELNSIETMKHIVVIIICVLIMIVGLIGNTLVLIIYKLKFKRSSARTYILALAFADVSVCIVGVPYHVMDLTMLLVYDYPYVCKAFSFLIGACTNSSIFILLVVGLDRFLMVTRPLKRQIVDFGDRRACLIAVAAAIALSLPNGVLYGRSTVKTTVDGLDGVACFLEDDYVGSVAAIAYMGLNILTFISILLVLTVIYGIICKKIFQQDKSHGEMDMNKSKVGLCGCFHKDEEADVDEMDDEDEGEAEAEDDHGLSDENACAQHDGCHDNADEEMALHGGAESNSANDQKSNKSTNKSKSNKQKNVLTGTSHKRLQSAPSSGMVRHVKGKEKKSRKITLMMLTITAVFVISYLPFIIICILTAMSDDFWDSMGETTSIYSDLILRMYLINNMANPIIYSFWDLRFRRECVRLFKRMCACADDSPKTRSGNYSTYCSKNTVVSKTS